MPAPPTTGSAAKTTSAGELVGSRERNSGVAELSCRTPGVTQPRCRQFSPGASSARTLGRPRSAGAARLLAVAAASGSALTSAPVRLLRGIDQHPAAIRRKILKRGSAAPAAYSERWPPTNLRHQHSRGSRPVSYSAKPARRRTGRRAEHQRILARPCNASSAAVSALGMFSGRRSRVKTAGRAEGTAWRIYVRGRWKSLQFARTSPVAAAPPPITGGRLLAHGEPRPERQW